MKKRSERRKHCAPAAVPHRRTESAMAVVRQSQNSPAADPLPGGAGPPKFNQLEMVTTCTYRLSLVKIDARNFEFARPPSTRPSATDRTDYNTLRRYA